MILIIAIRSFYLLIFYIPSQQYLICPNAF
nr:MAG TPA: hypothetical protein [Caudoviricetes sp.]